VNGSGRRAEPAKRRDLQGLRSVAILLVLAFHAGLPLSGGFVGVDVFFVVSGFVITNMLTLWIDKGPGLSLGSFYLRRVMRLIPALAVMVLVVCVASGLLMSPFGTQAVTATTAIGAMGSAANFVIARTTGGYFDLAAEENPLLNTWSLSVEAQLYNI